MASWSGATRQKQDPRSCDTSEANHSENTISKTAMSPEVHKSSHKGCELKWLEWVVLPPTCGSLRQILLTSAFPTASAAAESWQLCSRPSPNRFRAWAFQSFSWIIVSPGFGGSNSQFFQGASRCCTFQTKNPSNSPLIGPLENPIPAWAWHPRQRCETQSTFSVLAPQQTG